MTSVTLDGTTIHITLTPMDKIWALRGDFSIPLASVESVSVAPPDLKPHGIRAPGTHVPGVYRAGTWRGRGTKEFWNVRDPHRALVLELQSHEYTRVIVEVADPASLAAQIEAARIRNAA